MVETRTMGKYALSAVLLLVLAIFFIIGFQVVGPIVFGKADMSCVTAKEAFIVGGESLTGTLEPQDWVEIWQGFYDCNEVRRGDLAVFFWSDRPEPIVKVVRGIPGDQIEFVEFENGWNMTINGRPAMNSKNEPYLVFETGRQKLVSYLVNGRLGEDAHILLGHTNNDLDSATIGPLGRSTFIGKAIPLQ